MKAIVTGGCGFIGHHFVEHLIKETDWDIVVIDKLSYASSGFDRLKDSEIFNNSRLSTYPIDLCVPLSEGVKYEIGEVNYIFHLAAETHVDKSISHPQEVISNNIISTINLLEYSRTLDSLKLFIYFSTDEVYGPAFNNKLFKENERHNPGNPYSASKSAAEMICHSYYNTFSTPLIVVNVMNAFGERQHKEKFIPKVINLLLDDQEIEIYTDSKGRKGSRFYIHSRNIAAAVLLISQKGNIGECYNIAGKDEITNLKMAQLIASTMNKELKYKITNTSRPGNDIRYGLDGTKLNKLGWNIPKDFESSLIKTIKWTLNNKKWLD